MGNIIKQWLNLDPNDKNGLTSSDIYFDTSGLKTVTQAVSELNRISVKFPGSDSHNNVIRNNSYIHNEVGSSLHIGRLDIQNSSCNFILIATFNLGNSSKSISKAYIISFQNNHTSSIWKSVNPLTSSSDNYDFDVDLDVKVSESVCDIRFRCVKSRVGDLNNIFIQCEFTFSNPSIENIELFSDEELVITNVLAPGDYLYILDSKYVAFTFDRSRIWNTNDMGLVSRNVQDALMELRNLLVDKKYIEEKILSHNSETQYVHGIEDTSKLALKSDLINHEIDHTDIHGISDTYALQDLINQLKERIDALELEKIRITDDLGNHVHDLVTTSKNGFMSKDDKLYVDNIIINGGALDSSGVKTGGKLNPAYMRYPKVYKFATESAMKPLPDGIVQGDIGIVEDIKKTYFYIGDGNWEALAVAAPITSVKDKNDVKYYGDIEITSEFVRGLGNSATKNVCTDIDSQTDSSFVAAGNHRHGVKGIIQGCVIASETDSLDGYVKINNDKGISFNVGKGSGYTVISSGTYSCIFPSMVFSDDDTLYVMGGQITENNAMNFSVKCFRYTFSTNTWTTLSDLPKNRCAAAAVHYNGNIFLFGGYYHDGNAGFTYTASITKYNIASNTHTILGVNCNGFSNNGGCVVGNCAYVHFNSSFGATPGILRFHLDTETWDSSVDLFYYPSGNRRNPGVSFDETNKVLYIIGGTDYNGNDNFNYFTFNINTLTFSELYPLPDVVLWGIATGFINNKIYLFGTRANNYPSTVHILDPITHTLSLFNNVTNHNYNYYIGCAVRNNSIYFVGGSNCSNGWSVNNYSTELYKFIDDSNRVIYLHAKLPLK